MAEAEGMIINGGMIETLNPPDGLKQQCEPLRRYVEDMQYWKDKHNMKLKEHTDRMAMTINDQQKKKETHNLMEQWKEGIRKKQDSHSKPLKPPISTIHTGLPGSGTMDHSRNASDHPSNRSISQSSPSFPMENNGGKRKHSSGFGNAGSVDLPQDFGPPSSKASAFAPQRQHPNPGDLFYPSNNPRLPTVPSIPDYHHHHAMAHQPPQQQQAPAHQFPPGYGSFPQDFFQNLPECNASTMQSFLPAANGSLPEADPSEVGQILAAAEGREDSPVNPSTMRNHWPPPGAPVASQQLKNLVARSRSGPFAPSEGSPQHPSPSSVDLQHNPTPSTSTSQPYSQPNSLQSQPSNVCGQDRVEVSSASHMFSATPSLPSTTPLGGTTPSGGPPPSANHKDPHSKSSHIPNGSGLSQQMSVSSSGSLELPTAATQGQYPGGASPGIASPSALTQQQQLLQHQQQQEQQREFRQRQQMVAAEQRQQQLRHQQQLQAMQAASNRGFPPGHPATLTAQATSPDATRQQQIAQQQQRNAQAMARQNAAVQQQRSAMMQAAAARGGVPNPYLQGQQGGGTPQQVQPPGYLSNQMRFQTTPNPYQQQQAAARGVHPQHQIQQQLRAAGQLQGPQMTAASLAGSGSKQGGVPSGFPPQQQQQMIMRQNGLTPEQQQQQQRFLAQQHQQQQMAMSQGFPQGVAPGYANPGFGSPFQT